MLLTSSSRSSTSWVQPRCTSFIPYHLELVLQCLARNWKSIRIYVTEKLRLLALDGWENIIELAARGGNFWWSKEGTDPKEDWYSLIFRATPDHINISHQFFQQTNYFPAFTRRYRKFMLHCIRQDRRQGTDLKLHRKFTNVYRLGQNPVLGRPPRLRTSINSFTTNDCYNFFEVRNNCYVALYGVMETNYSNITISNDMF